MCKTVFFYLAFVFSLIVTGLILPIWHIIGFLGLPKLQGRLTHYTSCFWARFLIAAAGVHVTVNGMENVPPEGAVLFISNHQGSFDIPVLLGYINKPKGFLAKIELKKLPVVHSWMIKMGCSFIDRSDLRQSIRAMQKCVDVLKSGQSMVVFPEGTRSREPGMGEFKKGSLRLAEKADVPIIPVSIQGTCHLMEKNNNRIRAGNVVVNIAAPIRYKMLSEQEKDNINSIVREIIVGNL